MALTTGVVDRRLPIHVLPIHIVSALFDEVLDGRCVALSTGVEEWGLLQSVFLLRVDAKLDQHFDHFEGQLRVADNAGRED